MHMDTLSYAWVVSTHMSFLEAWLAKRSYRSSRCHARICCDSITVLSTQVLYELYEVAVSLITWTLFSERGLIVYGNAFACLRGEQL